LKIQTLRGARRASRTATPSGRGGSLGAGRGVRGRAITGLSR
jgi:hypothetical protein